ncbi:MAG: class I SAM-dependent methyltransferase [Marinilabiliaceae bacterium]|nr:class I SAM-dependent methyltransferase [Marinilabiliaceae bacterium]
MSNLFDNRAKEWDNNPVHFKRSDAIAEAILNNIPLNNKMRALEYGAGTGILSNILKDKLKEIALMDNSGEMIKMIREKICHQKINNFIPIKFDLEHEDYHGNHFDFIFSQMVMHHVPNVPLIIKKLFNITNSKGYIAIADLYPEDGSFHRYSFNGHLGFDPDELKEILYEIGYSNVSYNKCFELEKEIEPGILKIYPIFLITGQKK